MKQSKNSQAKKLSPSNPHKYKVFDIGYKFEVKR